MGRRKPQIRRISGSAKRRREGKKSSNLMDEKRRLKSEKTVISTNKSFGGQNLDILLPCVDNNTLYGSNQGIGTKRKHEENKPVDSPIRRERNGGEKTHRSLDSRSDNYEGGSLSKRSSATCETRSESDGVKSSKSRKRRRHKKRREESREESDASPCKVVLEKVLEGKSIVESLGSNSSGIVESSGVPRAIRNRARKKLLVLDLNGILCDVVYGNPDSRKPHKRVGKSAVFKRPFCDEFMKFCCEKFDIGVWSSRKMENVHGVVNFITRDIKDTLLFCWDASKCTYTGYKTIEDRHKPLVLKQLKKIWNKEGSNLPWEKGQYSPSNTLLIDDSPYKALCNPPYTGVFPYPYSYKDDNDNSLGPGGDLRVYLEGLALADDVQCYVREHSFGQCAITTTHPSWKYYEQVVEMINRSSGKTLYDHPFVREDWFSHPPLPEGPQMMSDSQRDYHLRNQSSSREDARIPLPGQGFASSSSLVQGSTMHPQSVYLPREFLPNRLHSFPGEHVDARSFSRVEFSSPAIKDFPYSQHPHPYCQQQNVSSYYPSNMSSAGLVDLSLQKYPSSFLDNRPPHYNPFASTFEKIASGTKYSNVSGFSGRENDVNYGSKYDSPFSSGHALAGRPESRLTSSQPDSKRSGEQSLPRAGLDPQENADALSDERKLVIRNPVAGDAYVLLFDSIEPSSNAPKKFDHIKEPNSAISDAGINSKLSSLHKSADIVDNSKQKGSSGAGHKSEVEEFGEVATDAEVGVVENASPQPEKDWSPDLPVDMGKPAAGEIEIDQVLSPGKSKKGKESRSMKLFKVALADFVKEVLKPSWRQGNMSKEAFKTIVKKTLEKVSGAMPSHQIPKSPAKINQYVESSQRKLTKLVMAYVDKYVKM